MPQDFTIDANDQQIDEERLKNLRALAKQRGEVLPYDNVKVYATQKLVDAKAIPEISEEGQEFIVHSSIAKKMEKAGKVTMSKPEKKASAKPATTA